MIKSIDIIKSIFLLNLAVSGNFVAETLGCKTQLLLHSNMYAKQIVIFLMIYFTLGFVGNSIIHPLVNLKFTFFIWILYLFFTKMNIKFTIFAMALITISYVIYNYKEFLKESQNKDKEDFKTCKTDKNTKEEQKKKEEEQKKREEQQKLEEEEQQKKKEEDKKRNIITQLDKIFKIVNIMIILVILTGFIIYFIEHYNKYKEVWSSFKFIFGVTECKSHSDTGFQNELL